MIESVIALAILALSVGALAESLGGSIRRTNQARAHETARLIAESLLGHIRAGEELQSAGHTTTAGTDFSWTIAIRDTTQSDDTLPWQTCSIAVAVSTNDDSPPLITLQSIELLRKT